MYYRIEDIKELSDMESPYEFIKKLNIYLVRHGESEGNILQSKVSDYAYEVKEEERLEDIKVRLTPKGEEQARNLGSKIKQMFESKEIDRNKTLVLVSPYERARKTFELANMQAKFNAESVFVLNDLREMSYGAFDFINHDKKMNDYKREYAEYNRNTLKYFKQQYLGESPANVCDRCYSVLFFIKEYMQNHEIENVFVIAHGDANRCLAMDMINLPPEAFEYFKPQDNAKIIKILHGKIQE